MGKASSNLAGGIDFKRVLQKYASRWYIFVLAMAIAFVVATLKNRYVVPIYSLSTSVLIEDKSNKSVLEARGSISADPLFLNSKLIDNQIALLKSFAQIKLILQNLDFEVSYYARGAYIWEEVYHRAPFIVEVDSGHPQMKGLMVDFRITDRDHFIIGSEQPGPFRTTRSYRFGEPITGKEYSFTIRRKEEINPLDYTAQEYGFQINDLNQLTAEYREKTLIQPEKSASVINISSSGPNKDKVKDFLNELTRVFLVSNLEKKNQILTNTISFIDKQLQQLGAELDSAESKLENFRKNNKFMQLNAKASSVLAETNDLEKQRANLIADKKYYEYLLDYLQTHNSFEDVVMPSTVGLSLPLFSDLVLKLSTVSLEKEDLIANSSRKNPYIQVLEEQITNMKIALIENMRSIIQTTDLKIEDLNQRIGKKETDFASLPGVERQYLEIERRYNVYNGLFDFLLRRKSEVEIQRAGNTPDHEVVDYAGSTGSKTISASPKTAYINAMVWAFLIPAVFLFLVVVLNNRIMAREDIEKITDLAIVGSLVRNTDKRTGRLLLNAYSLFTETLRSIKIKLNLDPAVGEQVILVTSASSGDGKTFLAVNLATIYAMAGKKTLLLGFDLHRPQIASHFNLDRNDGVTNYLINDIPVEEVIQHTFTKNLDILLAGPTPPNSDELIESEKTRNLFVELRRKYEFIILDTPSIGVVGDAFLLDRYSDVTLFVARFNHTTKKFFAESLAEAIANRMKRIHLVYTDLRYKIRISDIQTSEPTAKDFPIALRYIAAVRKSIINLIRKF